MPSPRVLTIALLALFALLVGLAPAEAGRKKREKREAREAASEAARPKPIETLELGEPQEPSGDVAMELWSSQEFRDGFLGTYGVNSEVEPRITTEDREALQDVLPLLSSDLEAAAAALEAIATPEASAIHHFTLGNVYFQQEELEKAAARYRAAIDRFPSYRRAWKNLGIILTRTGDLDGGVQALSKVVQLGGDDALTYGLLGYAHAGTGRHVSAESAYRNAVLLEPDQLDWKLGLLQSLFRQRKHDDAVALSDELLADHPARADLWLLRANASIGMGQPMQAAESYEIVRRLGDVPPQALLTLGDIYVNEEAWSLAVDAYAEAATLEETDASDLLRRIEALAQRGALHPAETLLGLVREERSASLSDEQSRKLLKLRARLAVAAGESDEAVAVLEEIVALDPLDGEALILLGQHHQRQGEPERAILWFERAEGLEGHRADARLRHAQVLVEEGRYREALPLLREVQELEPRDDVADYLEQVEKVARARN